MGVIKMGDNIRGGRRSELDQTQDNNNNVLKMGNIDNTWKHLAKIGRLTGNYMHNGVNGSNQYTYQTKDIWKNQPCFVIGAGISLKDFDFSILKNCHTIGINHIIEDFTPEWLIFLDERLLNKISDINLIKDFQGHIFSSNKTGLLGENVTNFYAVPQKSEPTEQIEDGLYNSALTGLCALNLAIITGANPIYLLGFDCGAGKPHNHHYKKNYGKSSNDIIKLSKYRGTSIFFEKFEKYSDRIKNVSKQSLITTFDKIDFTDIPKSHLKKVKKNIDKYEINGRQKTICHVMAMDNIEQMGDITRNVFYKSDGKHITASIRKPEQLPKADIYLLECFINSSDKFLNFKRPHPNAKIVSLIHSCGSCMPSKESDITIALTEYWKQLLEQKEISNVQVINGAIDKDLYKYNAHYESKNFGRITRYSIGKIHPKWNDVVMNTLSAYQDARCIMFVDSTNRVPIVTHSRCEYDTSININMIERKAQKLSQLSVATIAHDNFKEIFPMATVEMMAAGLPIISLSQPSMDEVIGKDGIICSNIEQFEKELITLLPDIERKKELGNKMKQRAFSFTMDKMIKKYNNVFQELLK